MRDKNSTMVYLKDVLGVRYVSRDLCHSRVHAPKPTKPSAKAPAPGVIEASNLPQIQKLLENCQRCKLSQNRQNIVFGSGSPGAEIMFVGEGPGEQEDSQGLPFVGRAGQLLTKMIEAMGPTRNDVYIANVVKCRPPNNRNPQPDEISSCSPFLKAQLAVIKPKVIIALGTFAAQTLLGTEVKISALRGKIYKYEGCDLIATFHPAYLLRNPSAKKEAWEDLKLAMTQLQN